MTHLASLTIVLPGMRIKSLLFTFAAVAMFAWPAATYADTNKTITTFATPGVAHDVVVVGNYAYVADFTSGIDVINVTTPASPSLVASYQLPAGSGAWSLDIVNQTLYAVGGGQLVIYSISTATPPVLTQRGVYGGTAGILRVGGVVSDGSVAYLTGYIDSTFYVQVVDVSNPDAPVLAAGNNSIVVNATADLSLAGDYLYVVGGDASGVNRLEIIRAYPILTLAGTYTEPDSGAGYQGVQVYGSVAYINDVMFAPAGGFRALNIANPAAVTEIFHATNDRFSMGIAISNGYAFLARSFTGGVTVYDISSSSTPSFVVNYSGTGSATASGNAYGVAVANDIAYVAGNDGLQLIDVSNPDKEPPIVTPVGDATPVVTEGGTYTDPGITTEAGATTVVAGKVDTNIVGQYVLTYTVTDRAGNVTIYKRTVIVGPKIEKLTIKNYSYTLKVGKKNVVLKPFPEYRGAIVGRKMTVDKKTNPLYVFIATDAMTKPEFVIYNASGKQVTRYNLMSISTKGLQLDIISNPKTLSVFVAVAPKANGLTATIFNVNKSGFKSLKTVTAAKVKGTLVMKWIKGYENEYILATLVKGKTATPYVWRYNSAKKSFIRDTKFDVKNLLSWTKTSIKLK